MLTQNNDLLFAFLIGVLIFLLLSGFVTIILFLHNKKVTRMSKENQDLKGLYEQGLLRSKLEVEEQTRMLIARELHDNLGAISSLIKINLGLLSKETNPQKRDYLLEESRELIKNLTVEIKQLSVSMNTERLNHLSLAQMLQRDVDRLERIRLFHIQLNISGNEIGLPADRQIILYRICQELLNNCIKHANASKVDLSIRYLEDSVQISISDDGVGFIPETKPDSFIIDGSGLRNMIARAALLDGTLSVESAPGQGASFLLHIPIK